MLQQINNTASFLKQKSSSCPKIGIVLGTGLNVIANQIEVSENIPYDEIPNFPVSTVEGHEGMLIFGKLNGVEIIAMQGRFHYYEGYDMKQITFPIRVMKALGVETVILSNASGGMNPSYKVGDIVLIEDHINFFPDSPLRGKNEPLLGDRFPDMSEVYDKELIIKTEKIASKHQIECKRGVYIGVPGPTFETLAEYRMFYRMGADCVGMSTVPEAIVARHGKMKCICFSIITDLGIEGQVEKVSHKEVLDAAQKAKPKLTAIVKELVTVI